MPITVIIPSGEIINSQVNSNAGIERTKLATEQLKDNIPLELVRVWDAFQTSLPTTAASDDLGLIPGTWATDAIVIQTSDAKNTTVTQRARFVYCLPYNYVSGQLISAVAWAGMKTTVANGTATIDFEVYKKNDSTTINSLTASDRVFVIDPTGLSAGDELDVRVTIAITDSGTGTAVIGRIMKLYMLPSVKG